jgi:hypothetical protein
LKPTTYKDDGVLGSQKEQRTYLLLTIMDEFATYFVSHCRLAVTFLFLGFCGLLLPNLYPKKKQKFSKKDVEKMKKKKKIGHRMLEYISGLDFRFVIIDCNL